MLYEATVRLAAKRDLQKKNVQTQVGPDIKQLMPLTSETRRLYEGGIIIPNLCWAFPLSIHPEVVGDTAQTAYAAEMNDFSKTLQLLGCSQISWLLSSSASSHGHSAEAAVSTGSYSP